MKYATLIAAALVAFAGAASAQTTPVLNSSSQVVLQTLAPDLDASKLTPIQVRRINNEVASNSGLTKPVLQNIVRN
ncbi:hypothetical protein [Falsirhodobacter halotolerans]|uniref:hypothetical protein n=1 Tax=Falsirhodobacter halotolerans TaxID=1146892 RepID=UPI001FD0B3CD|nr:hypothetical protein [Falsirhodobacter halotolerans]MCJ8138504.1 hypothetical protein [Falsirhodobacter halotolerans]